MLTSLSDPSTWIALLSLSAMEIVLGIDNIIFISILTGRLPEDARRSTARKGIVLALVMRIGLLFAISWIMGLTNILFEVANHGVTGKHIILFVGGLFLIGKATLELHHKIEDAGRTGPAPATAAATVRGVLLQILLLDMVFSLDSVITAVGMVEPEQIWIMVVAIVSAVVAMWFGAEPIGAFVEQHPTLKVLALAFLILIGVILVAESIGQHISKGYVYFAMAFAFGVELINLRMRRGARAKT
jgi:predicted tellurium resistance membrane protein TerC